MGVTIERKVTMTKSILIILPIFVISAGTASASMVYVPNTYPTMQAAVDRACPGGMVYVHNGTYMGNVTVKGDFTARWGE